MGNGVAQPIDSQSIALRILSKFSLVLSRTKDALIADLKEKFPDRDFSTEELIQYLDELIKDLGFDFSEIQHSEFDTVILQVLDASETLGDLLSNIDVAFDLVNQIEQNGQIDEDKTDLFLEDIENLTFQTIEVIQSFKALADVDFSQQNEKWQKFLSKSNFKNDFPKRLFDHILSTFLRNATEVFSEDIEKLRDFIQEKKDELNQHAQNLVDQILDEIEELEELIRNGIRENQQKIQRLRRKILLKLNRILQEDILNPEVKALLSTLKRIFDLQNYFERLYAVLEFLKIIAEEKIPIYDIENELKNLEEYYENIRELYVLHWDRFAEFIKNPKEYFLQYFEIDNEIDAEEVLKRILDLARAFGLDIPDFTSMKQMLVELLLRLENELKDKLKSTFKDEIQKVIDTIKYVLAVLERIGMQIREELLDSLDNLLIEIIDNTKLVHAALAENPTDPIATSQAENPEKINKIISDLKICPGDEQTEEEQKDILIDILLPLIQKRVKNFKEFENITEKDWKELLSKIGNKLISLLENLHAELHDYREKNLDTDLFQKMALRLNTELAKQTENLPANSVELAEKIYENPDNLSPKNLFSEFDLYAFFKIIYREIKNTTAVFSAKKHYAKFKNATNQAFAEILNQSNQTAQNFKNCVPNQDLVLLKSLYNSLIDEALSSSWKEISKKIFEVEFSPYIKAIESATNTKANEVLVDTLTKIEDDLEVLGNKIEPIQKFVEELFPMLTDVSENGIDNWKDGAKFAYKLGKLTYEFLDELKSSASTAEKEKLEEDKEEVSESLGIPTPIKQEEHLPQTEPFYKLDPGNLFASIRIYDSRINNKNAQNYLFISLNAFVAEEPKQGDEENSCEAEKGIYIIPIIKGSLSKDLDLGANHILKFALQAIGNENDKEDSSKTSQVIENFRNGSIGIFFTKKRFEWMFEKNSLSASAKADFRRKENSDPLHMVQSKYLDFTIANYPQTLNLGHNNKGFFIKYIGEIQQANLLLKLKQINSFFDQIIKEDLEAEFDAKLIWDLNRGFHFDGSAALKLDLDVRKKLSEFFTLEKLVVECGWEETGIRAKILTSFTANFGSVQISMKDLGVGSYVNVLNDDGAMGDFHLSPTFEFPSAISIAIKTDAIKGGGLISYCKEKQEFIGMVQLSILETIEASALMMLSMQMPDGSKGYSFVGLISVNFFPGIPLGMGFSLTGIGGALGLNRDIDSESIQSGVRTGTLGSVFFVDDVETDQALMVDNLGNYFPIKSDQFFFGVLARITYADKLNIDFGLLITLPKPFKIIIVGAVHAILPDKKLPLIEINAYFAGIIDFDNKKLSFDASLVDSKIAFIEIYGDLALRLSWGDEKVFVLSAGGFHPSYKPDPSLRLGVMKRLGMKVDYGPVKQTMEAYFAITSNTVQFGARVDLYIGAGGATLTGFYGFDCIFQFDPFRFMVEIYAGFKAKYKRWTLASVNLDFTLSGPAPWNVKGKASFKILFFKVSVKFNKTWGQKQSESQISYIDIYELFSEEYLKFENWKIISSGKEDHFVQLANIREDTDDVILEPFDGIGFQQSTIPLNTEILQYGESVKPKKYSGIVWLNTKLGNLNLADNNLINTHYDFAPSLFFELSESEKLSLPSYVKMDNGIEISKELNTAEVTDFANEEIEYGVYQDEIVFYGENGYEIEEEEQLKQLEEIDQQEIPIKLFGSGRRISAVKNIALVDAFKTGSQRRISGFRKQIQRNQFVLKEHNQKKMDKALGRKQVQPVYSGKVLKGLGGKTGGFRNIQTDTKTDLRTKRIELADRQNLKKDRIRVIKTYANKGIFK